MAIVVGQIGAPNTRKVLIVGTVTLLVTIMTALIFAIQQYMTTGIFFQLRDLLHHEAFEVIVIAFGVGVFVAALGFSLYYRPQPFVMQYPISTWPFDSYSMTYSLQYQPIPQALAYPYQPGVVGEGTYPFDDRRQQ